MLWEILENKFNIEKGYINIAVLYYSCQTPYIQYESNVFWFWRSGTYAGLIACYFLGVQKVPYFRQKFTKVTFFDIPLELQWKVVTVPSDFLAKMSYLLKSIINYLYLNMCP